MKANDLLFATDTDLGYVRAQRVWKTDESLSFDEDYLRNHLPLVNFSHPKVVRQSVGFDYVDGVYSKERCSLVAPISSEDLCASEVFREINSELNESSIGAKVAWRVMERRQGKLHATVMASINPDDQVLLSKIVKFIEEFGLPSVRVGGPFIGTKNAGRIYFKLYPSLIDGKNYFQRLQEFCGQRTTEMFLIGFYNLVEELSTDETAWLASWTTKWTKSLIAEKMLPELRITATNDDLVLTGRTIVTLGRTAR